jgi:hypothetical protein
MKIALTLAAALAVLSPIARAAAPPAATMSAPPATAAPAAPAPGATVSGVTVKGAPRKQCAPKDAECIAIVMAEVKELYPEQLKKFCYQQKMDVMRQDMQANIAGWCDGPGLGATAMCSHYVSPVVKKVCAPDPPAVATEAKK